MNIRKLLAMRVDTTPVVPQPNNTTPHVVTMQGTPVRQALPQGTWFDMR